MHNIHDLFAQAPEKMHQGIQTQSHYLTMRDGTQIAVDLLLPLDLASGVRLPVVLTMTRYWRSFERGLGNYTNNFKRSKNNKKKTNE